MAITHNSNHQHCTKSEGIVNIIVMIFVSNNVVPLVLGKLFECRNKWTNFIKLNTRSKCDVVGTPRTTW